MDISLLPSKIEDAVRLSGTSSTPKFVGFLNAEEISSAIMTANRLGAKYRIFGGYENAERCYFGAFPDWCEEKDEYFPITPLTFSFRSEDTLTHREFLGSFMSLGIARETVGDILIEKGRAVAFFSRDIAPFVASQLTKVSRVGVKISEGFLLPLPEMSDFKEVSGTVASARLDSVVATLINISRSAAAELIENKMVSVNSVLCEKTVKQVKDCDKITVRGKGKFIIESVSTRSKKDRIILKAKKYI